LTDETLDQLTAFPYLGKTKALTAAPSRAPCAGLRPAHGALDGAAQQRRSKGGVLLVIAYAPLRPTADCSTGLALVLGSNKQHVRVDRPLAVSILVGRSNIATNSVIGSCLACQVDMEKVIAPIYCGEGSPFRATVATNTTTTDSSNSYEEALLC